MTTRQRILDALRSGPATVADLMARDAFGAYSLRKQLWRLHADGMVAREAGVKTSSSGPAPAVWRRTEAALDEDSDELWPKRKTGYGTNPPGEELARAWAGERT